MKLEILIQLLLTLKTHLKKVFRSEYRKGFLYIFSSKLLIVVVTFITTPVFARLYDPADYGIFGLMNSVLQILVFVSSLTLPTCLLTISDEDIPGSIAGIVGYSFYVNMTFILVGITGLLVTNFEWLNLDMILLIPLSAFLLTSTQVFANLNIRTKSFSKNVVVNLYDNFSIRISGIAFGLTGFTNYGLFISEMIGKLLNLLKQLSYKVVNFNPVYIYRFFNIGNIRSTISKNRNYPLFNLPSTLIGNFSSQIIVWTLGIFFSTASVGHFNMAVGLLNIPLLLLANSFQPLITSKFLNYSGGFPELLFWKMMGIISITGVCIYLTIYLIAPYFVIVYLGHNWEFSVLYVQILCLPFFLQLMGNSIGGIFIALNKQRDYFVIKLVFLCLLAMLLVSQLKVNSELKAIVIGYSIVVSMEELTKVIYLTIKVRHVAHK